MKWTWKNGEEAECEEGECPGGNFQLSLPLHFLSLFDMLWRNKYIQHSSSMEDFSTNIFFSYNLEFFYDSHFQVRAREKEVWLDFFIRSFPSLVTGISLDAL